MPDSKITALTSIGTSTDPANDPLVIVDVSDTSMAASGTTKKVSLNNLLACSPTATLASATITGDLTVRTNKLAVTSTGTGFGTASPTVLVDILANSLTDALLIRGNDNANTKIRMVNSGASGEEFSLSVGYPGASNSSFVIRSITASINRYIIDQTGAHFWATNAGTAMTLNSTGLGVGTAPTSTYKFESSQTASSYGGWFLAGLFSSPTSTLIRLRSTTPNLVSSIGNDGDGGLKFIVNGTVNTIGTDALTITPTGNVGIGVTPSAWGAGTKALEFANGSVISFAGYIGTVGTANSYYNGTSFIYKTTAAAARYDQDTGAHKWFNAPSGTAGNAITFTQAMTLDASGNLLVGVASNPNTARAYFRYDTLTTQPVINSASVVAASTSWSHFIGQSGNGSSITTSNIFIYGNGNIQNVNGVYGTISDLRLKENISDARNYLADLLKLRVVKYSLKEEASAVANKLGFIAQEVEQVFPAMVDTDPNDGNKGIKTSVLIPMLVKSIQELTARVQTLEAK